MTVSTKPKQSENAGQGAPIFSPDKFSRTIPAELIKNYKRALADERLVFLAEAIGALDAEIADLLNSLSIEGAEAKLREVHIAWVSVLSAYIGGDAAGLDAAFVLVDGAVREVDKATWAEIVKLARKRAQLAAEQQQRKAILETFMTREQVLAHFSLVLDTITRNVSDQFAVTRIMSDVQRIANITVPLGGTEAKEPAPTSGT